MNLSPAWIEALQAEGVDAEHWSSIGEVDTGDEEIMAWADARRKIVLTNDLDFGTILAVTRNFGPSVILLRTDDVRPATMCRIVAQLVRGHASVLNSGALIVVDVAKTRVRVLPLRPDDLSA